MNDTVDAAVLPMITVKNGSLFYISTPCGHNFLFDKWEKLRIAKEEGKATEWYLDRRDWTSSPLLTPEIIEEHRLNMTPSDFNQEFNAQFLSPKGALFPSEWLANIMVEPDTYSYQRKMIAVDSAISLKPTSDWQGIVFLGLYNGTFYADAYADRLPIPQLLNHVKDIYNQYKPEGVAFEVNGFQALIADEFYKLFPVPPVVIPMDNRVNKHIRINRLSTLLSRGKLKIFNTPGGRELWRQLSDYGADNKAKDDLPDALEMAWRALIES